MQLMLEPAWLRRKCLRTTFASITILMVCLAMPLLAGAGQHEGMVSAETFLDEETGEVTVTVKNISDNAVRFHMRTLEGMALKLEKLRKAAEDKED